MSDTTTGPPPRPREPQPPSELIDVSYCPSCGYRCVDDVGSKLNPPWFSGPLDQECPRCEVVYLVGRRYVVAASTTKAGADRG